MLLGDWATRPSISVAWSSRGASGTSPLGRRAHDAPPAVGLRVQSFYTRSALAVAVDFDKVSTTDVTAPNEGRRPPNFSLLASSLILAAVLVTATAAKAEPVFPNIPDNASDGIWDEVNNPIFFYEADEANTNQFEIPYAGSAFAFELLEPSNGKAGGDISDLIVANGQILTFTSSSAGALEGLAHEIKVGGSQVETDYWQSISDVAGQPLWVFSRVDAVPLPKHSSYLRQRLSRVRLVEQA